jgi:hypothetical protein
MRGYLSSLLSQAAGASAGAAPRADSTEAGFDAPVMEETVEIPAAPPLKAPAPAPRGGPPLPLRPKRGAVAQPSAMPASPHAAATYMPSDAPSREAAVTRTDMSEPVLPVPQPAEREVMRSSSIDFEHIETRRVEQVEHVVQQPIIEIREAASPGAELETVIATREQVVKEVGLMPASVQPALEPAASRVRLEANPPQPRVEPMPAAEPPPAPSAPAVEVKIGRIEFIQATPPPPPEQLPAKPRLRPARGFTQEEPLRRYLDRRWY